MFEGLYNHYGWTYNQAFAWMFAGTTLVWSAIALAVSLIFFFIALLIKKSDEKQPQDYNPLDNEGGAVEPGSYHEDHRRLNEPSPASKNKQLTIKIFNVLAVLASWYALLAAAIFPSVLSGLGVIPIWSSMIITFLIFAVKFIAMIFYWSPHFLNKNDNNNQQQFRFGRRMAVTMSMNKVIFGLYIGFAVTYTIVVPLITADTCMDFFNYGYGEKFQDFGLSTRFSRYFQLDTACPQGQVCQFYATLAEDGASQVILNIHTGTDVKTLNVNYDVQSKLDQEKIKAGVAQPLTFTKGAKSFYIDLETRGARYVHSVFVSNLLPNTLYYFEVNYNDKVQAKASYLTLPTKDLERDLVIASGGDAGTSLMAREMTASLANYNLDAIIVGGDLAYDNGIRSCYPSFDFFLNMFKPVNDKLNRLIPFITSIGNHDIGFNAFQDGKVDITQNLFYTYFPAHSQYDGKTSLNEVPDLDKRLSYNYHLVGNTLQLSLDSGYMFKFDGVQKDFIIETCDKYSDLVKMANFHVPMFPTCFNPLYDDVRTLDDPRKHWAPLFNKYKFSSIFENHVHLYKASFPLDENGKRTDQGGVLYFGDGNWGINPDQCYPLHANGNQTGILQDFKDETHVWIVNVNKDTVTHQAINVKGNKFGDVYSVKTKDHSKLNYDL